MTVGELDQDDSPSVPVMLLEVVRSRMLTILFATGGLMLFASGLYLWYKPTITMPRSAKLAVVTAFFATPWALLLWIYVKSKLFDPEPTLLQDFDARRFPGSNVSALWRVPADELREFSIEGDGGFVELAPNWQMATNIDVDEKTAESSWVGEYSHQDIVAEVTKLELIMEQLHPDARRWWRAKEALDWLVRAEAVDETAELMETLQEQIRPNGADGVSADERIETFLGDTLDSEPTEELDDDVVDELLQERADLLADQQDPEADRGGADD